MADQAPPNTQTTAARHTTDAWEVRDGDQHDHVFTKDGRRVCSVYGGLSDPEGRAKARLIAAAPELLNAAKEAIQNSWLSTSMLVAFSSVRRGAEVSETDRSLAKVYKLLADAISKAEGRA